MISSVVVHVEFTEVYLNTYGVTLGCKLVTIAILPGVGKIVKNGATGPETKLQVPIPGETLFPTR